MRAGIAQVPQGRGTFPELTVEDNLRIGAYTRRDGEVAEDIERWYETFPRLAERRDAARRQPVGRRAADAGHRPGADEPAQAAAVRRAEPRPGPAHHPGAVRRSSATLSREQGIAVLLVEQNANLAMKIAHRVYLLETGRIVASGDAATIAADDSIRKAYLGY